MRQISVVMQKNFQYRPPAEPWLEVMHQDDDILVLNKQSGLLSVKGKDPDHADCLEARAVGDFPSATVVHRLDLDTSGVMIMALNMDAHRFLSRGFQDRKTDKTYYARVLGHPVVDSGTVDLPLKCDWPNRPKQKVDFDEGRSALTHWFVETRHDDGTTLMRLKPVTGRSHQLRVHMLEIGHPILGDRFYGQGGALDRANRLMLHAADINFYHPRTNERVTFAAPTPFD